MFMCILGTSVSVDTNQVLGIRKKKHAEDITLVPCFYRSASKVSKWSPLMRHWVISGTMGKHGRKSELTL